MEQTKREKLLASLKSRNKEAKLKMAQNAGFDTVEEFKKHLEDGIQKEKLNKAKEDVETAREKAKEADIVIHNVHILDASGSMKYSNKIGVALKGINDEVKSFKEDTETTYYQTFVSFSGSGDVQFHEFRTPMKLVPKISISTRGMTALNEAIVITLEKLMSEKIDNEKIIVKIFTDGQENNSKAKYTKSVEKVIKTAEENDITVTFVGTDDDVKNVVRDLGIHGSNTLTHNNTLESVSASFVTSSVATKNYVAKAKKGEDVKRGFYKGLKK